MRPLLACLLLALSLPAAAQIYSYTDASGNTVFTNEPPQGSNATVINLPETNTIEAPPISNSADNGSVTTDTPQAAFSVLQITGVPADEALRANNGSFSVGVSSVPAISASQQLQLVVDGQPYGQPSSGAPLQVSNLSRGEHSLAVQVLSGDRVVQQSNTVTFTVQRVALGTPTATPRN
jgi:hypothetical protein